jgi:hypothetical protein
MGFSTWLCSLTTRKWSDLNWRLARLAPKLGTPVISYVIVQDVRVPRNPIIITMKTMKTAKTCIIPLGVTEISLVACLKDTQSIPFTGPKPRYQRYIE